MVKSDNIGNRERAYKKWIRSKLSTDFDKFKLIRSKCTALIRSSKKKYFETFLSPDMHDEKTLWRRIKQLGITPDMATAVKITPDVINKAFLS